MYDSNNVFAKIIKGEISANKIYEDQNVIAFYDLYPVAPTHVLIIPKKQYKDYKDFAENAPKEEVADFFIKVNHVADLLKLESYRLITNYGSRSGQSVFHFHVHIIGGQQITNLI
ncbi:hypothetical protein phytr_1380 [Candidatus Phycorickettsia trachydisci]|uniref:HIT domain-containing protein n=1 Tax=Candidatus Phycorickettsia trachydisci TaxID=2115978 RepID=A0A2P1P768_9RICK|nr:HIT domain-containing protein [Candidatus Phycorickettsia trachydisci]AVP87097.1 hypothetical protein phytr_1380 [Candidatus Phycorickettsia trachydisci]